MNAPKKTTKVITRFLLLVMVLSLAVSAFASGDTQTLANSCITQLEKGKLNLNTEQFLDSSVVHKLPDTIKKDQIISLIVTTQQASLLDAYEKGDKDLDFTQFAVSEEAAAIRNSIQKEKQELLQKLDDAGIEYKTGADYSAVVSGFEIEITAADFESISKLFDGKAKTHISEVYKTCDTQVVTNEVDVYDTGIFNSSAFGYDGSGIVVAVLDTGIDYDHSAFSLNNFTSKNLAMSYNDVASILSKTNAYELVDGLTAADVYINEKIPFAFDYADNDSDAYPINSDHGTHVSGIIAGKDDTITGVAPNAQLVEMKIFSDVQDSARASWILNAVEDCVVLGVDVINMSIGTACGFARTTDEEFISGVYERIREQGISLIVAASNSFNSAYGSDKNGNLPLTSNPDSGTVGSPSTYDSAMSVASVAGVETPYILYNETVIYFTESVDRISEEKHFVEELLGDKTDSIEIEYILIPGAGRSADYTGLDVSGKIVLVSRGSTTFEEKAAVAQAQGAAGLIIYNNVSGDIKMNVGDATIPVCSISQDNGEMLAAAGSGKITISPEQTAGPFMDDFSSWGPNPSLQIKPEITAHGGSILSCVPGQDYDRISGTSMACPNVAGITALLRQYVKENFPDIASDSKAVNTMVNRLMMSTADILLNKNGNPYAVRKQGAGLANLHNCSATTAYIQTYDAAGNVMDKTKIELGDDASKTGVYTMTFTIVNFGSTNLTYDLSAFVMTEGVSDTKTSHGDTTVTEEAYILTGASVAVSSKDSTGGSLSGSQVTVQAGNSYDVTVTVTLSDADKKYMNDSFENGMYVEGFIVLKDAAENGTDLNVPYLAFYGDWTKAPIFDLTYFDTNADELDMSLDPQDKTMADAYASRPIGGLYSDYVSYLGSYYFQQNPSDKQIAADPDRISLTNQTDGINSLRYVWAGLLRNAAKVNITITEDATGKVVYERVETDIRKSYGDGGSIYPANIEIEFSAIEQNLKNNTKYTVTLTADVDYGDGGKDTNENNTMSFPLYVDFQAPAVTGVDFYTEYDNATKQTRYFAKMNVYDNHYSMGMQLGYVGVDEQGEFMLTSFEQYLTPIYSSFNATSEVIYELTDYIDEIRMHSSNRNTFTVACYDYAMNYATYEIELPDDFVDIVFAEDEIVLSPNQVIDLEPLVYPEGEWSALLDFFCTSPASGEVARVVNNKLVAVNPGNCVVIARDPVTKKQCTVKLRVLAEGDEGFNWYDKPVLDTFELTGYYVNKAYDFLATEDRDIGMTGDIRKFNNGNYVLSLYPSESVTLEYILYAYFEDATDVVFTSSNENIVKVDKNGTITAVAEGFGSVSVQVTMDGKNTYYSKSLTITVKDPYVTSGPTITAYYGVGGEVRIPESLHATTIGPYAFANFTYIDKTEEEFEDDDSSATKITYIGENTITAIIIPEGVETIEEYAFANLTSLTTVVLPSTLTRIDQGAFYGCTALSSVTGLENVKFINQSAFENCNLKGTISLDNAVCVADRAFAGNSKLSGVKLSSVTRSIGAYAFSGCKALKDLTIDAANVKIGKYAFANCQALTSVTLNTNVLAQGAFYGCTKLETVNLGKDVAQISEYAFGKTAVKTITFDAANPNYKLSSDGKYVTNAAGTELVLVLPSVSGSFTLDDANITSIGTGAFAACNKLTDVKMPYVTSVGDYAFAECTRLRTVALGELTHIGDYAFYETKLSVLPDLSGVTEIGSYAFSKSDLTNVVIPDNMIVGDSAFRDCDELVSVTIGNNVTLGECAFYLNYKDNYTYTYYSEGEKRFYSYVYTSPLHSLTIGDNVTIGDYAFCGAAELETVSLGNNAIIGQYAFYNASKLTSIDLSKVLTIGDYAFSGDILMMGTDSYFSGVPLDENGYYMYSYHAPMLKEVNLSSATSIGVYSFAYCRQMTNLILGDGLTNIPEGAFNACIALNTANLNKIVTVADYAFAETKLTKADLSAATTIGEYAFCNIDTLTEVQLNSNGCIIEEGAFSYAKALATLNGEEAATSIGDYAFAYTAITEADLSAAQYIGSLAFYKEEKTDFTVKLGTALVELGDNPFAMCKLAPFCQMVTEQFNGKDYTTFLDTYIISDTVQVIKGSLYQNVPNGLELVTFAGTEEDVTVADKTVRISAMAFAGHKIRTVSLPHTVRALGHKAFFGCEKLQVLTFASYDAPIMEEEYDYNYYASMDHIPASGSYGFYDVDGVTVIEKEGLGITDFFMWNAVENPTCVYYGATFVDYIGHFDADLIMVRPANGRNYSTFILDQYFTLTLDGAAAADKVTQAAIDAIDRLPDPVRLSDKADVQAARAAYDLISTLEQKSLVTNYAKLTQAEKRISDLEFLANGEQKPVEPEPEKPQEGGPIWIVVLLSVIALPAIILVIHSATKAKQDNISFGAAIGQIFPAKKEKKAENDDSDQEESAEQA